MHWSGVTGFTPKMFFLMPDRCFTCLLWEWRMLELQEDVVPMLIGSLVCSNAQGN